MEVEANAPWTALDTVGDAIEADTRTLGASVAGKEDAGHYVVESAFVSVEASSVPDACRIAESVVAKALATLDLDTHAKALGVYDEEANFFDVRPESGDIANPSH
jgi:hypothetical protein